jgi:pyruvate, water dikinase
MRSAPHIRWFQDCDATSTSEVGGKVAGLGELLAAGVEVPPGFAVTVAAHDVFLERHALRRSEEELLTAIDYGKVGEVAEASERLRSIVEDSDVPPVIVEAIRAAYKELSGGGVHPVPVAVRSSAVAEDLEGASFAGQLQTYLWIEGADSVVENVRRCWSGFFTVEALTYRQQHGLSDQKVLMSVGVQRMVPARSAGVMFTVNPLNGDRSKIVIESTWGLGESLVSGEVDPDRFTVDKVTLEVLSRAIASKQIEHRPDVEQRRVVIEAVAPERRDLASLSDAEVIEIARLGKMIERHHGAPQDIEWAVDDETDRVVALQARPETVWSRRERQPTVEKKGSALDYVLAGLLKR